jgi:TusE/DsrC/DsvC family sulfur relay protein
MRLETTQAKTPPSILQSARSISVEGRTIVLDSYGHLIDPEDWSRAITEQMAAEDGVKLTDDHWLLIDFLHRFYKTYEIAPEIPILSRNLCKDQHNCRWTKRYIESIFPGGAKTACRYAGLPTPVGRSCL